MFAGQAMPQQPAGYGAYGATSPGERIKLQRMGKGMHWFTCGFVISMIALPTLVFALASCYTSFLDSATAQIITLALVLLICFQTCPSFRLGSRPYMIIGICELIALVLGYGWGDYIHNRFIKPHQDITNLNTYPNVNPAQYQGQQLMDAGVIEFAAGSHLDLSKSYGFKNEDVYCVVPIVGPAQNASSKLASYDFWAVGTNCCSGHTPDYKCGEYNNPRASKGLRLMRDDSRSFFRLAVEEAKAAYNIEASHPVFMYWMQNPSDEVNAYQDEGNKFFYMGVIIFGLGQALITIAPALLQFSNALCPSCCCDPSAALEGDLL